MDKKKNISKEAIVAEYLTGTITYRALKAKYGVPSRSICDWVMEYQDRRPACNIGLASVGQSVLIEIFTIFAIGSGLLTGKVLLKPARKPKPCPILTPILSYCYKVYLSDCRIDFWSDF